MKTSVCLFVILTAVAAAPQNGALSNSAQETRHVYFLELIARQLTTSAPTRTQLANGNGSSAAEVSPKLVRAEGENSGQRLANNADGSQPPAPTGEVDARQKPPSVAVRAPASDRVPPFYFSN
ncbi:uncharacterized protein LOC124155985 [Ischnura elegans]|uniref:uncharacterized protein LOC124155985 n=1 Tax=Ischnura elegans TaxID=197161 RepID=UPI001ED8906A|nr:uncharacterized protein LOC124155985 [Ischnura elegans]